MTHIVIWYISFCGCLVATRKVLKAILNIANFIFKNVIMLKAYCTCLFDEDVEIIVVLWNFLHRLLASSLRTL